MHVKGYPDMQPQTEEQITELKWVGKEGMQQVLANTFPSIVDVCREGGVL